MDFELAKATLKDRQTDSKLRKIVGYGALVLLTLQLVVADGVFLVYGFANGWLIPPSTIHVWLGSTVVEVAVITQAVALYLFPSRGAPSTRSG